MPPSTSWSGQKFPSVGAIAARLGVLLLPALVLLVGTLRTWMLGRQPHLILALGTAFQILVCFFMVIRQDWRKPAGPLVLLLYLVAFAWLWLGGSDFSDWYVHFAQAILLVVSMAVFALQVLSESGAPEVRRARLLAQRLAERKDWPAHLTDCRMLPEVKALRESIHVDASPALSLLLHPRPQVCIAALAALEFRKDWKKGQAELVLDVARRCPEPGVRAAAVSSLANVDDRLLVEQLAELLNDPSWEVRRAATEALLWDTERRWAWIRHIVRRTLSNATHQEDGPLLQHRQLLTPEAVKDLTAWATEKGVLGLRAAQTLAVHYGRALNEQADEKLIENLRRQLIDPHAPTALRMELAQLLQQNGLLNQELQERLLDPLNPAPLRLIAAEALLAAGEHTAAVTALRDVAHLPNREIALATADIVQRRLGVDLGLALGQPLPQLNSRKAAEVTRRVMAWAVQLTQPNAAAEPLRR